MKVIETISYYLVEVRLHENEIQCYDLISKKIIASEPYTKEKVVIKKHGSLHYRVLNEENEPVSKISIDMNLISKISELQTEAVYILDLQMLSQSRGYYFGYYEIGEFELIKDMKLVKIRSYPVQNCTIGRITESNKIYIGLRENNTYFLAKLNWKTNQDPKYLWKKVIPSAIMVMGLIEEYLYIGLKNGFIQIWDIQKDECMKNIRLFSSTISVMIVSSEIITLGSQAGDIARMSKDGNIQWKSTLSQEKIVGIYEDMDQILVINSIGEQFYVDINSGNPIKHRFKNLELGGNCGLSSNIIKYRERFVMTGYGGIWAFRWQNSNNLIRVQMGDPLMRIIRQHPFGFFSGDDNGCVCFWSLGDIKIKVEDYYPPLRDEIYLKVKSTNVIWSYGPIRYIKQKLSKKSNSPRRKKKSKK